MLAAAIIPQNIVSHFFSIYRNGVFEFDGKELKYIEKENVPPGLSENLVAASTNTSWCYNFYNNEGWEIMDKLTYETIKVKGTELYNITSISSNPGSSEVMFAGIRYSDIANVVGKISPDGTMDVISATSGTLPTYQLIPIN